MNGNCSVNCFTRLSFLNCKIRISPDDQTKLFAFLWAAVWWYVYVGSELFFSQKFPNVHANEHFMLIAIWNLWLSNFKCFHLYVWNFVPTKFIAISIYRVYTAKTQQQQLSHMHLRTSIFFTAIINFIFIVKFTHDLRNWNHYKGHLLRLHKKFIRKACDKVKNIWTQSSSAKYLFSSMSFHHPFFSYHRKSCRDEYEKFSSRLSSSCKSMWGGRRK